ncbi:protein Lilipod [Planococcus citri]|uniref:protein Lilipod n=1 Tax=Planococcus citri TaxID=170843 RepID=UPI0031F836CB
MMDDDPDLREQIFHNTVRENIIFLLLFLLLYVSSYAVIGQFKRKDDEDYITEDSDDVLVYQISLWLCTFSLAISAGAAFLLPFSIASNEVLLLYPNSYYVQWLNHSLVQGLWNHIFLFSNLSLFVLLPFAYFFIESEGFSGHRKGIKARVYETTVVLLILFIFIGGITYLISSLIDGSRTSGILSLLNLWGYHLPFLYSCISFLGVLMLLLCTPLGFARLFTVVGQFLVKPQFLRDIEEEYLVATLEEQSIRRRLENVCETGKYLSPVPLFSDDLKYKPDEYDSVLKLQNGALRRGLLEKLQQIQETVEVLDFQRRTSFLQRNFIYPLAMIVLLAFTVITVFIVLQNTIELLIGFKALPISTRQFTLGISSLSKLGPFGAALEVILILYLTVTSTIGLYSIPVLSQIQPKFKKTSFVHLIVNCALVLILSSALPLLSKILGFTNFDLLGDFGQIEWLGNFKIVLIYNLVFMVATVLCLVTKVTASVRRELYRRLKSICSWVVLKIKPRNRAQVPFASSQSSKED